MNQKIRLFKHLKAKYADLLISEGSIRIGTMHEYKNIENQEIQDKREGNVTNKYAPTKVESFTAGSMKYAPLELSRMLQPASKDAQSSTIIMMPGSSITTNLTIHNCYIYCLSHSFEKDVFEGYDACVEILDIDKFNQILAENIASKKNLTNLSVKHGAISYIGRDFPSGDYHDAVFLKEERFHGDQEYRLSFEHESFSVGSLEALSFEDDRLKDLVTRVY